MRVVQIIPVGRERRTQPEETRLGRYHCHLTAGSHLLHPQTSFAFPPAVCHQPSVRRNSRKIRDFPMVGKWPNAEIARIECRCRAAVPVCKHQDPPQLQRHRQNGSADQRSSVTPDFSDEYSTGR